LLIVAPLEQDHVFRVPINDTKPIVYYCSQGGPGGGHCQIGMVGVVNPSDDSQLKSYAEAAAKVFEAKSPGAAFGGELKPNEMPSTSPSPSVSAPSSASASPTSSPSPEANAAAAAVGTSRWALGAVAVVLITGWI